MDSSRVVIAAVFAPFSASLYWVAIMVHGWFTNDQDVIHGWFVLIVVPLALGTILLASAYAWLVCLPVHALLEKFRIHNPIFHVGAGVLVGVSAWKAYMAWTGYIDGLDLSFLTIPALVSFTYWFLAVRHRKKSGFTA